MRERSSAKPPQSQHNQFTIRDPAMFAGKFSASGCMGDIECGLCRPRQSGGNVERIMDRLDQLQS